MEQRLNNAFFIKWSRSSGPSQAILLRAQTAITGWGESNTEMFPNTDAAYNSYSLVRHDWCNVGECPCRFKLHIRAKKIQTLLASGHNGNNKTFGLLVDTTENSMGGQRLKGYQWVNCILFWNVAWVAMPSLCSSPLLIHDIYKKNSLNLNLKKKHLKLWTTHTIDYILNSHIAKQFCSHKIPQIEIDVLPNLTYNANQQDPSH